MSIEGKPSPKIESSQQQERVPQESVHKDNDSLPAAAASTEAEDASRLEEVRSRLAQHSEKGKEISIMDEAREKSTVSYGEANQFIEDLGLDWSTEIALRNEMEMDDEAPAVVAGQALVVQEDTNKERRKKVSGIIAVVGGIPSAAVAIGAPLLGMSGLMAASTATALIGTAWLTAGASAGIAALAYGSLKLRHKLKERKSQKKFFNMSNH